MTISMDHRIVAAAIIVSPAPQPIPVGGAIKRLADEERAEGGNRDEARAARRGDGTAIRATQMNIVFWMKAAVGRGGDREAAEEEDERDAAADDRDRDQAQPVPAVQGPRFAPGAKGQGERDQHDRSDAVLGGRVDRGVRHELHAERVEVDGETADRGRPEGEEHASPRGEARRTFQTGQP